MRLPASSRRPSTTLWLAALLIVGSFGLAAATLRAQDPADSNEAPVTTEKVVKKATPRFVEALLDFDGGVTLESLKIFVRVFKSSVADYKKFLSL